MARATLGDSNCPCQEDYGEGPCWCYVVISHDPVLNILEAPYYENPFEVVPIDGEYFIENVIVTHFEQTTSNLPNWKFQYPNCPYATLTKYSTPLLQTQCWGRLTTIFESFINHYTS